MGDEINMRKEIKKFSRATGKLPKKAVADLVKFWAALDHADIVACREALDDFLPRLVEVYGSLNAQAAVEWYADLRVRQGIHNTFTPTPAPLTPAPAIHARVRSALAPLAVKADADAALADVSESVEGWVHAAKRDTIVANVARDPAKPRFARVPMGPTTCEFCLVLAGRDFVYYTRQTAGELNRFHGHCDCEIVPGFSERGMRIKGYEPEILTAQADEVRTIKEKRRIQRGVGQLQYVVPRFGRSSTDGTVRLDQWDRWRNELVDRLNARPVLLKEGAALPPLDLPSASTWPKALPRLNDKTLMHVLYGDRTGGGHMSGYGWVHHRPEFPPDWGPDEIVRAAQSVLEGNWRGEKGRCEGVHRGVKVCVYVKRRGKSGANVVSIFPVQE